MTRALSADCARSTLEQRTPVLPGHLWPKFKQLTLLFYQDKTKDNLDKTTNCVLKFKPNNNTLKENEPKTKLDRKINLYFTLASRSLSNVNELTVSFANYFYFLTCSSIKYINPKERRLFGQLNTGELRNLPILALST